MRTTHPHVMPGRRLRPLGPRFPRSVGPARPAKSDTPLDYRERTISRTEVAILGSELFSAETIHVPRAVQVGSWARTASGKRSGVGAGR
jgi:hypothetical protein